MIVPVNVKIVMIAKFNSIRDTRFDDAHRRIVPVRFLYKGDTHKIKMVRASYTTEKGPKYQIHFVVQTHEDRYFDIVYLRETMEWVLLLEHEDPMFVEAKRSSTL